MPKPATVLTSMRLAAGENAALIFNVDLNRAQADTLKAIDLSARSTASIEVLRKSIDRLLGELVVREADLKRFDNDRRARIAAATYADEEGADLPR